MQPPKENFTSWAIYLVNCVLLKENAYILDMIYSYLFFPRLQISYSVLI